MKSEKHSPWFDEWLLFMEDAFEALSAEAFLRLETRIIEEIESSRKTRKGSRRK